MYVLPYEEHVRICVLYEFKLGRSTSQACDNLNRAFGQGRVSVYWVRRWYRRFRQGDEDLNLKSVEKPSYIDPVFLRILIRRDPYITTKELAQKFGVRRDQINRYLKLMREGERLPHTKFKPVRCLTPRSYSSVYDSANSKQAFQASSSFKDAEHFTRASRNSEMRRSNGGTGIRVVMPVVKQELAEEEPCDRVTEPSSFGTMPRRQIGELCNGGHSNSSTLRLFYSKPKLPPPGVFKSVFC